MTGKHSTRLSIGVALLALMPAGHLLAQETYGFTDFQATGSRAAHEIFLQGLLQLHNFEYGDARASFQAAQAEDPDFVMAYWGEALTHEHPLWSQHDPDSARAVLAKLGVPPHLFQVIQRINTDLQAVFELGREPVTVPCTVGVKQGCTLSPTLFFVVMQACLESLGKVMSQDSKLEFRTDTRTGKNGGKVSGTDWTNQDEFTFSFWASF